MWEGLQARIDSRLKPLLQMDLFEYISVLTSIIIGLGMAHLLRGLAGLVQHPGRDKVYWVHLVWVGYMFFNMVFFWWWEFSLGKIETWFFQDYLFIVFFFVIHRDFREPIGLFSNFRFFFFKVIKIFFEVVGHGVQSR